MDKVRNNGMNFNENRNSSCCGWSRSLIYIIKLTYLVGLSNTWNLYKMVCKRQNLIINGMVKACLDCFVVFNLVLACARLAIRAPDKRLRKKSLRSEKASDFPAHFQKNRFSRRNVPCRSVSLPSTRATCNFFRSAFPTISEPWTGCQQRRDISGEIMANTTERASTLSIIARAANESSSNVITFWNAPWMKLGASGHSFFVTTATT